jgi:hypothetical protein
VPVFPAHGATPEVVVDLEPEIENGWGGCYLGEKR